MKRLTKIYFLVSLAILSGITISCDKDEVTPTKGEVVVTLKKKDNAVIADADVKLATSLSDLNQGFFLTEAKTDATGVIKLGVLTAGNYYLSVKCKIGLDAYDIIKAIQVKPGERSDLIIQPEDFAGKMHLSLINNSNWSEKLKISGIKIAVVPINDVTEDENVLSELLKFAVKQLQTDANGEVTIEKIPAASYRVLLYTDEEHPVIGLNTKNSNFIVESKKENNFKIPVSPTMMFLAEKKWTIQSVKDYYGQDISLDYTFLSLHLNGKAAFNSADGPKRTGTFSFSSYSNGDGSIYLNWSDGSYSWNTNFNINNNAMKISYYDYTLNKSITIDLKK